VETLGAAAAHGATVVLYGALSPDPTPLPLFPAIQKGIWFRGYTLFEISSDPARLEPCKRYIFDLLKAGKVKPILDKDFPFDQIVAAHKHMESSQQTGKITVTVVGA
jgi:NADPH:quinone reductase